MRTRVTLLTGVDAKRYKVMFNAAPCREVSSGRSGRHIKTGPFLPALTLFSCYGARVADARNSMFDFIGKDELAAGLAAVVARGAVGIHAAEDEALRIENVIRVELELGGRVAVAA